MALIDFILNLVALLLWLSWLAIRFDPLARTTAVSLVGTLRKAEVKGPKRWKFLAGLVSLLLLRAVVYWQFGASLPWNPSLDLGIIDLSFRSDYPGRMLVFSLLSFVVTLAAFYFWLLLLSMINTKVPDTDTLQKLVRLHLRRVEGWPRLAKLCVPFLAGWLFWLVLHPVLAFMTIAPENRSFGQLFEQAVLMGASSYLSWKYLIVGILLLHLVNSYVYLGNHAFWNFVNVTARNLLFPLRWLPLRLGKVDFLPLAGVAGVFFVTELITNPPVWPPWYRPWFYHSLPF